MTNSINITVAEITVTSGKKSTIKFDLDGRRVEVPVSVEVKAHFDEQFVRPNPTPQQKKRFVTLMNLLRSAYLKGRADGAVKV